MIPNSAPSAALLWVAGGSIVGMAVGAFGPWARALFFTVHGTDGAGDGWLIVFAALVAGIALIVYSQAPHKPLLAVPLLAGISGAAVAVHDISNIARLTATTSLAPTSIAWGVFLAFAASTALAVTTTLLFARR